MRESIFIFSLFLFYYRSFCPLLFPLRTFSPSQLIPFRQSNESRRTRKKGTPGMRTVMSTERREIARCNFVRLLAEATCREDYLRGKELLGSARMRVFFFFVRIQSPFRSKWKYLVVEFYDRSVVSVAYITFTLSLLFFTSTIL